MSHLHIEIDEIDGFKHRRCGGLEVREVHMSNQCLGTTIMSLATVAALVWLAPVSAAGQTPTSTARPAANAEPWQPPRTPDGQPDLQGVWMLTDWDQSIEVRKQGQNAYGSRRQSVDRPKSTRQVIVDPPDGLLPYQPWAAAKHQEIDEHLGDWSSATKSIAYVDTQARCLPAGVPRFNYAVPYDGYQFLQIPGYVVMLGEWNHAYRIIPVDGRPHISPDIRLWMGDSRGHWEGKTLVVDTTNLNGQEWLDMLGTIHSDALHVVERYTITNADRIDYEAVIEDPKVLTRPAKLTYGFDRGNRKRPPSEAFVGNAVFGITFDTPSENYEIYEYACHEGNGGPWGGSSPSWRWDLTGPAPTPKR